MTRPKARIAILAIVLLAVGIVLAANAHLLLVAERAQSDCVAHVRPGDIAAPPGNYSAARSSC